jgi:DNA helicase-2/ATP-dependent DNA helicase PcrA
LTLARDGGEPDGDGPGAATRSADGAIEAPYANGEGGRAGGLATWEAARSATNLATAAAVEEVHTKMQALAAGGKPPPAASIMNNMMAVYAQCRALALTGDPDKDWTAIREVLEAGACPKLRDIGEEARNVRSLGRGTQLRQALSQNWRSFGAYRNALAILRDALVQKHFSNRARPERGISS